MELGGSYLLLMCTVSINDRQYTDDAALVFIKNG